MTRRDRLIERIRARPPEADFNDVRRLLEMFGWILSRRRGSHVTFVKEGEQAILTVPLVGGRRVRRRYLIEIIERLGLDE